MAILLDPESKMQSFKVTPAIFTESPIKPSYDFVGRTIPPLAPNPPPSALAFVQEYVTFNSCGGTNGNHNVQCSIHIEGTSASSLTCTVANPAISGGDNTGNCQTDTGLHLSCLHAMTIAQMKIVHTRNNPYAYPSDGGKDMESN